MQTDMDRICISRLFPPESLSSPYQPLGRLPGDPDPAGRIKPEDQQSTMIRPELEVGVIGKTSLRVKTHAWMTRVGDLIPARDEIAE